MLLVFDCSHVMFACVYVGHVGRQSTDFLRTEFSVKTTFAEKRQAELHSPRNIIR